MQGSWVHQASAYTCLNPSVPSNSNWQGLEWSVQLTLLSVDYGPQILRGEDADGLTQGTGTEISRLSAVPGNSADIKGKPQLYGPIKIGILPVQSFNRSLWEECPIFANTMSVRLASSINCQSSLVRTPGERRKVVTMAAPLNKYGFVMSFWSMVFMDDNGLRAFLSWWSKFGDSSKSEQK